MTHTLSAPVIITNFRALLAGLGFVASVAHPSSAVAQNRVVLQGAPVGTTNEPSPDVHVSAPNAASYKYSINGGPYSPEFPVTQPIRLTGLVGLGGHQFTAGTAPLADFLTLKNIDDSFADFFDHVTFEHLESQVQVTYMVNKLRTAVRPDNVLNLRGANVADLKVTMNEKAPAGPRFELSSLAISGGELFQQVSAAGIRTFVLAVPPSGDTVLVTPQANNSQTAIVINGQPVTSGQTVYVPAPTDGSLIVIDAGAPDGAMTSYRITVRQDGSLTASSYRSIYLRAFAPASAYVSLQNVGANTVTYGLTFNQKFGLTLQGLVDEIAGMAPEYPTEPDARKVWRFVRDNRYHFWPLTRARWNQSPALFFSSIGFGFCDDSAALFYHLMTAMGYPARVWYLSGRHSVPEVFINNRWELWDPDLQVYYQNRNGLVAGVEELANDTDLISHPLSPVAGALYDAYSEYVTSIYGTHSDTYVVASAGWLPLLNDSSMQFEVPAGGTFEFPGIFDGPLSGLDLEPAPSYANARLIVPEGFSGSVSMPLVIQSVGWSNNPRLSVITSDGAGKWDTQPTVATWTVDVESPYTVATQPSGVYNSNEPVTLTAVGATVIYYSTDGSIPTEVSSTYSTPITVAAGATVRFFSADQVGNKEVVRSYGPPVERVLLRMSRLANALTFSASASGGAGKYEYLFRLYAPQTGWSTVRPYSELDNWVWDKTGAPEGRYTVEVMTRNQGTTGQIDAYVDLAFDVTQAAPAFTNPGNQTSTGSATIALQLMATDPDGDTLTYTAVGLPPSLTVNRTSGLISGALSIASGGKYSVTATVSDGSVSSSQTFTWTVGATNPAPIPPIPGNPTGSTPSGYGQAILTDAPTAYWRLDEATGTVAASSAGTAAGTLVGGVTLGQPGALADGTTAMRFDGSTGYVQAASTPALQLAGDLTIETWVNVSLANRQTLISKDYLHEFELTLETDGRLNLYQGNGSTYDGVLSTLGAVTANTWQHVVVTRTAATKTVRFYVNGRAAGSRSYVTSPTTSAGAVFIGRTAGGTQYVNGRLDEVALYAVVLSPAQISAHWARHLPTADSANYLQAVLTDMPAAYWRLDETEGTIAASSTGAHSGTLVGGVTLGQPGALADGSSAMRFDGSTGYVQVSSSPALQLAGDLTIEMWVNVSLGTRQTLISKGYLHEFELTLETDGKLNLYQGNGSSYQGMLSTLSAVAANTWQHVVVTRSAATKTVSFYLNGTEIGSGSYVTVPTTSPVAVYIGRTADGAQAVNGRLDEVALYPTILSRSQIATHFAKRALTAVPATYHQAVVASGPAAYWRFDETTGTLAASSAGPASGTLVGGVTLGQPGALANASTAMGFDGSTGYVQVVSTAELQLAADLTIEMWVNVSLAKRQTLISKGYLHEFELTLETNGRLNLYQGNGSAYSGVLSDFGAVTANLWQHVVVTRTAATKTVRFYVNGIASGGGSYVAAPTASQVNLSIGRTADGAQCVNGLLDEVALYSAALSSAQISAHWAARAATAMP